MKIANYLIEKKISENIYYHLFQAKHEASGEKRLFFIKKTEIRPKEQQGKSKFFLKIKDENTDSGLDYFTTDYFQAKFYKERIRGKPFKKKELKFFIRQLVLLLKDGETGFNEDNLLIVNNSIPAYLPMETVKEESAKNFLIKSILMNFYTEEQCSSILSDASERNIYLKNDLDGDLCDLLFYLIEDSSSLQDEKLDGLIAIIKEDDLDLNFSFLDDIKNELFVKFNSGKDVFLVAGTDLERKYIADYLYHEIYTKSNSVYIKVNKYHSYDYSFIASLYGQLKRNKYLNDHYKKNLSQYFKDFLAYITKSDLFDDFEFIEDRIIQGLDTLFKEINTGDIVYVISEETDYVDKKSLLLLNKLIPVMEERKLKYIFLMSETTALRFIHYIEDLDYSLKDRSILNNADFEKIVKQELNLNDIDTKLFINSFSVKTEKKLNRILLYINQFKMAHYLNQDKNEQEIIQFIKKSDFTKLATAVLNAHKKLAEVFVFFSIIETAISYVELDTLFQNSKDMEKILGYLENIGILNYRNGYKKGHELSSTDLNELILKGTNKDTVLDIIRSVSKSSKLRDIFDLKRVIHFLYDENVLEDLCDIQVKFALYLEKLRNYAGASENLESALEIMAGQNLELSKSLTEQITFTLLKIYEKVGLYENALKLADDILRKNFQLEYDKRIYLQFKISCFYYKMDKLDDARQFIDEQCLGHLGKHEDINYRLQFLAHIFRLEHQLSADIDLYPDYLNSGDVDPFYKFDYLNNLFHKFLENDTIERINSLNEKINTLSLKTYHESELKKNIAKYFIHKKDYEKALRILDNILPIVESENDHFNLAEIFYLMGSVKIIDNDRKEAIEHFRKALNYYLDSALNQKAAITLSNIAVLYKDFGELSKSIECEKMAIKVFRENHDLSDLAYSYLNLGHCYSYLLLYSEAEQQFSEAEKIAEYLQDYDLLGRVKLYQSHIFAETKRLKEADLLLLQTLNLIGEENKESYINYLYYKSYVDIHNKRLDDARRQLLMAFDTEEIAKNSKYNFAFTYLLGKVLRLQEDYAYSEKLLLKSLKLSETNMHLFYQFNSLLELKELYKSYETKKYIGIIAKLKIVFEKIEENLDDKLLKIQFDENAKIELIREEIYNEYKR